VVARPVGGGWLASLFEFLFGWFIYFAKMVSSSPHQQSIIHNHT
jgi:hypothetical protein